MITRKNGFTCLTFNTDQHGEIEICDGVVYFKRDDYETNLIQAEESYMWFFTGVWGNKFKLTEYPKYPHVKTPCTRFVLEEIKPVTIGEIRE